MSVANNSDTLADHQQEIRIEADLRPKSAWDAFRRWRSPN